MNGDSVKKIINNSVFIANLAPLLSDQRGHDPDSAALARAARTYASICAGLGIKPSTEGFKGCEQAQLLVKWCFRGEEPDPELMKKWTEEIIAAIEELANGKL